MITWCQFFIIFKATKPAPRNTRNVVNKFTGEVVAKEQKRARRSMPVIKLKREVPVNLEARKLKPSYFILN